MGTSRVTKLIIYWFVEQPRDERKRPTILALLNEDNPCITRRIVLPHLNYTGEGVRIRVGCEWSRRGSLLTPADDLQEAIRSGAHQCQVGNEYLRGKFVGLHRLNHPVTKLSRHLQEPNEVPRNSLTSRSA